MKKRFPICLASYNKLEQKKKIELLRASVVFMTAYSKMKGLGGHTGGAYDIIPELVILNGLVHEDKSIYPVIFDEAGHRVAAHYLMAALSGVIKPDDLLKYREYKGGLPGHSHRGRVIDYSSGRLGHLWSYVNGVAIANPGKKIILLTSDGSLQEGTDSEAARFAVANSLNIKIIVDDNNCTILGHPSDYMKGYSVVRTLEGHGITVLQANESVLNEQIIAALDMKGPIAIAVKRNIAPGIKEMENKPVVHDAIDIHIAKNYLKEHGFLEAARILKEKISFKSPTNRDEFGKVICSIIKSLKDRGSVKVFDNDLAGSTGLHHVNREFPDTFISGGIMERHNFMAAAGFGSCNGRQAIYATFSAFLEMIVSEMAMAGLNNSNVLAHFSHAGIDEMADNTSHYGINIFLANSPLAGAKLYYPADINQMRAVVKKVFFDKGLRFIFSPRTALPVITTNGKERYSKTYKFTCEDDVIYKGKGYVISYGEMLYRCVQAIDELDMDIGLINKACLNYIDEKTLRLAGKSRFVLVIESQNYNTGLGSIFGSWLLERGFNPKYAHMGVIKFGEGGLKEHIPHQGLDVKDIKQKIRSLL